MRKVAPPTLPILADESQSQCPFDDISPITDAGALLFEADPNRSDESGMTTAMKTAVSCFKNLITTNSGSYSVGSAWRSQAYQDHLRDVWNKWEAIKNNTQSVCASLKSSIGSHFATHGIVSSPAVNSPHTLGIAIDMTITGLTDAQKDAFGASCGLSRPVSSDTVHWVKT